MTGRSRAVRCGGAILTPAGCAKKERDGAAAVPSRDGKEI